MKEFAPARGRAHSVDALMQRSDRRRANWCWPAGCSRRWRTTNLYAASPHDAPAVRRPPSALQPCLPGRRERPGVAVRGSGRPVSKRVGDHRQGQPPSSGPRSCVLPPLRGRLQPRRTRRTGEHSRRRTLPGRYGPEGGLDHRARAAIGQTRAGRWRRTERPLRRLAPGHFAATPPWSTTPDRSPAA